MAKENIHLFVVQILIFLKIPSCARHYQKHTPFHRMGICSCGSAIEVAEIDIADNLSTSAIEGTSPVVSPLSSLSAASAETLLSRTSTYMPVMSGPKVPDATLLSLIRPTVRNSKW